MVLVQECTRVNCQSLSAQIESKEALALLPTILNLSAPTSDKCRGCLSPPSLSFIPHRSFTERFCSETEARLNTDTAEKKDEAPRSAPHVKKSQRPILSLIFARVPSPQSWQNIQARISDYFLHTHAVQAPGSSRSHDYRIVLTTAVCSHKIKVLRSIFLCASVPPVVGLILTWVTAQRGGTAHHTAVSSSRRLKLDVPKPHPRKHKTQHMTRPGALEYVNHGCFAPQSGNVVSGVVYSSPL